MIKAFAGGLIGITIILLGIYVWYFYVTTLDTEPNNLLFPLSIIQIGVGLYILFRAGKNSDPFKLYHNKLNPKEETIDVIQRSIDMTKDWYQTENINKKIPTKLI